MSKNSKLISALIAISAILTIVGELSGIRTLIYTFKPLTMIGIIHIAILAKPVISNRYQIMIIIGLIFSMGGDILLMLPFDLFRLGLLSFLVAHIIYIIAFWKLPRRSFTWWYMVLAAIFGIIVFLYLRPYLGSMQIPVAVYVIVIMTMGWCAGERNKVLATPSGKLALIGAILFIISDSLHAVNRFVEPFSLARLYILGTYFAAQWYIARSVIQSAD